MSAFLGKIHYWLFNKIVLQEQILEEVLQLAKSKDFDIETLIKESNAKFGEPVNGKLEDLIDHDNIHGWLQNKITSVEYRLAYSVTKLLDENILTREEIKDVFVMNARKNAEIVEESEYTANQIYSLVFDNLLSGMPCDRVNNVSEYIDAKVVWNYAIDIHKKYWDEVNGNVEEFHNFRQAWIDAFVSTLSNKYKYTSNNGINTIMEV